MSETPDTGRTWLLSGMASLVAACIAAALYVARMKQLGVSDMPSEVFFAGALLANGVIAMYLGIVLRPRIAQFFDTFVAGSGTTQTRWIFDHPLGWSTGIAVAVALCAFVKLIAPWETQGLPQLDTPLLWVLLFANIPVGLTIAALVRFWIASAVQWQSVTITALPVARRDLSLMLFITRLTTFGAALVTCLIFLALGRSVLSPGLENPNPLIVAFYVGALVMVVACYLVPVSHVATRLYFAKQDALEDVETRIAKHAARIGASADATPDTMGALIAYRDLLRGIRSFPPGAEVSFPAAAGVVVLPLLPGILDYVLPRLIQ